METPIQVLCLTVIRVTSRLLGGPPLLTWAWPREDRGGPEIWPEISDFYNIKVTSWLQHRFLVGQRLCAEKNPVIFCLTILDFQAWYCLIWPHRPYIVCYASVPNPGLVISTVGVQAMIWHATGNVQWSGLPIVPVIVMFPPNRGWKIATYDTS